MKRLPVFFLVWTFGLIMASVASAQNVNPCEGDIAKFCANFEPGMGRIANCLKQHEEELSAGCKRLNLDRLGDAIREAEQACGDDSVKFCGAELQKPGKGQLLNCLKLNEPSLSPGCKTKVLEVIELLP